MFLSGSSSGSNVGNSAHGTNAHSGDVGSFGGVGFFGNNNTSENSIVRSVVGFNEDLHIVEQMFFAMNSQNSSLQKVFFFLTFDNVFKGEIPFCAEDQEIIIYDTGKHHAEIAANYFDYCKVEFLGLSKAEIEDNCEKLQDWSAELASAEDVVSSLHETGW